MKLPFKYEGQQFQKITKLSYVWHWCWLKFAWSLLTQGQVHAPRGYAYENDGAVVTCYMRVTGGWKLTHVHAAFVDPAKAPTVLRWYDPWTQSVNEKEVSLEL